MVDSNRQRTTAFDVLTTPVTLLVGHFGAGKSEIGINLAFGDSTTVGSADGEMLIALGHHHGPTAEYVAGGYDSGELQLGDIRTKSSVVLKMADGVLLLANKEALVAAGKVITETARRTFSDRLKWNEARQAWDYTAGQYWPTEYRAAAWALLAKLLPVYASHRKYKNL